MSPYVIGCRGLCEDCFSVFLCDWLLVEACVRTAFVSLYVIGCVRTALVCLCVIGCSSLCEDRFSESLCDCLCEDRSASMLVPIDLVQMTNWCDNVR